MSAGMRPSLAGYSAPSASRTIASRSGHERERFFASVGEIESERRAGPRKGHEFLETAGCRTFSAPPGTMRCRRAKSRREARAQPCAHHPRV